jgi:magnesium-transporting ATPase (P-type)
MYLKGEGYYGAAQSDLSHPNPSLRQESVDPIYGLTESEAQARRKQGLGNEAATGSSRSYWDIARANLFTLFNNILFVLGVALLALALFIWFQIIWAIPSLGYFFGILVKPLLITSIILGVVVVWFFLMRAIWRANLFERFLGLDQGNNS